MTDNSQRTSNHAPEPPDSNSAQQNTNISAGQDINVGADIVGRDKVSTQTKIKVGSISNPSDGSPVIVAGRDVFVNFPQRLLPAKENDNSWKENLNTVLSLLRDLPAWSVMLGAFVASIAGGVLWNLANILLDWPYFMGGSGNEPHGFHAFVWGLVTSLPVILSAILACYKHTLSSWRKWPWIIGAYTILSGIAGIIFYDLRIRESVEAMKWGYGEQEIAIIVIWSSLFAVCTYMSLLSLHFLSKGRLQNMIGIKILLLQIPLSVGLAILAVVATLFIQRPVEELNQLRGLAAGITLRLGLFLGIVLSIWGNQQKITGNH